MRTRVRQSWIWRVTRHGRTCAWWTNMWMLVGSGKVEHDVSHVMGEHAHVSHTLVTCVYRMCRWNEGGFSRGEAWALSWPISRKIALGSDAGPSSKWGFSRGGMCSMSWSLSHLRLQHAWISLILFVFIKKNVHAFIVHWFVCYCWNGWMNCTKT